LGARLKRLWNGAWFFLFLGHDILCGIRGCWVTQHEARETETGALASSAVNDTRKQLSPVLVTCGFCMTAKMAVMSKQ